MRPHRCSTSARWDCLIPASKYVSVELRGSKATLKVGDFVKTYDHASFARSKTNLSFGFAFGTVSMRDVLVTK